MMSTFKSLPILNYRIWFIGALISNIGAWMQRTAQDWLVFAHLTGHDAGALGVPTALQLGPHPCRAPLAGFVADPWAPASDALTRGCPSRGPLSPARGVSIR